MNERQSVFNDDNYRVKKQINTFSGAEYISHYHTPQKTPVRQTPTPSISYKDQQKEAARTDDFEWVCRQFGKGSVDYRECRRRMDFQFRRECDAAKDKEGAACIRSHRYNPLG